MKIRFLVVMLTTLLAVLPLCAQESESKKANESDMYYVNVRIEKIYPYRKGYVVSYRKGLYNMAQAYLPHEWFMGTASKGDLISIGSGSLWPSMTVFYQNGEFSHVRLYVRKERSHETWGNISLGVNIDDRFENVDDLRIEF